MSVEHWTTVILLVASLTISAAAMCMSVWRRGRRRYTKDEMMVAYLKGFEDSVMGRKCDRMRALSERELGIEVGECKL